MNAYAGTKNEHHHHGAAYEVAQLSAAGFQWPPGLIRDPSRYLKTQPRFNGGIVSAIEVRLQRGDLLYRFAHSTHSASQWLSGCWWFDHDVHGFLRSTSAGSGRPIKDVARDAFAVLDEFPTDMGILLEARLKADFWAFKGITATADNKNPKLSRQPFGHYSGSGENHRAPAAWVMANRYGLDALQLFVPFGFEDPDLSWKEIG